LTGHDDNTAISKIVRGRKDAAMPEGEDGAMAGFQYGIVLITADPMPPDCPSDDRNSEISNPADDAGFETFRRRKRSSVRFGLHRVL
jgi:hypothetical protein